METAAYTAQNKCETDVDALIGIQTHDPCCKAALDVCLRMHVTSISWCFMYLLIINEAQDRDQWRRIAQEAKAHVGL